jgi:hypothetical protein
MHHLAKSHMFGGGYRLGADGSQGSVPYALEERCPRSLPGTGEFGLNETGRWPFQRGRYAARSRLPS